MPTLASSKIEAEDWKKINSRYPAWNHAIPFPPDSLLWSVGAQTIENFLVVGDAWAQLVSHYLPPAASVLEIGCGCGRVCRLLNGQHVVRYIGFDVLEANIKWCQRFIQPPWGGRSEFYWFDVRSDEYNPSGSIAALDVHFPIEKRSADIVLAASVFTHLLEPAAAHYLVETARVLSPHGRALLSIHKNPAPGTQFSGTETRIDIASDYFVELAAGAGMKQLERIEDFCGQEVHVFALSDG